MRARPSTLLLLAALFGAGACQLAPASDGPDTSHSEQATNADEANVDEAGPGEAPSEQAAAPPARAPLLFFCRFFTDLDPATFRAIVGDLPEDQYQVALAEHLESEVDEAEVDGFDAFWSRYTQLEADQRQPWIEAGIEHHGVHEQCAVFLADAPRTPEGEPQEPAGNP